MHNIREQVRVFYGAGKDYGVSACQTSWLVVVKRACITNNLARTRDFSDTLTLPAPCENIGKNSDASNGFGKSFHEL